MSKSGYSDPQIASFLTSRFFTALCFGIPLGMFIQTRRIKPILAFVSILFPLVLLLALYAIEHGIDWLLYVSFALIGFSVGNRFILSPPFILRNVKKEHHTMVFSLNFATWSAGLILSGIIIFILKFLNPEFFTDRNMLAFFCVFGFTGFLSALLITENYKVGELEQKSVKFFDFDWKTISKASAPTLVIAVGAGLTIPYINLFFFHVFDMDSDQFALLGTATSVLILLAALLVPSIKTKWGYKAITTSQTLSVIALFFLACTDFLNIYSFAIYMAIICFAIRQPLMNLANPMTSEMSMYYVGKKNQEMMSAIVSSIWAGSWFFSSIVFKFLRASGLRYGKIFLITTLLYAIGVLLYFFLIKDYYKKKDLGIIVD